MYDNYLKYTVLFSQIQYKCELSSTCATIVVLIITDIPLDDSLWKRKIRCYSLACTIHKQAKHQLTAETHMVCSFQTPHCIDLASFLSLIYPPQRYFFILFMLSHCQRFCIFSILLYSSFLSHPFQPFSPLPDPNDRSPVKVCTLLPTASPISSCMCTATLNYGEMHRKKENLFYNALQFYFNWRAVESRTRN